MPRSLLAEFFKCQRIRRDMTIGKLALVAGYSMKSQSKGANAIFRFETTGLIHEDLLPRLADALGIADQTVEELMADDCRRFWEEFEAWADVPIPPQLVVRLMAAVYIDQPVPTGLTHEQAEKFASSTAATMKKRVCLVLSRRLSIYFMPDGTVEKRCEAKPGEDHSPWVQIGSQRFKVKGKLP